MARKKKEKEATGFGAGQGGGRTRLTPVDVQQKVFRLAFRGYNERDVDEFLDQVTEDLATLHEENKRLREQGGGGGGGGEDLDAARSQAESIVREAREHAARLIEEAGGQSAGSGALPPSFLLRERDFLQRLASSVQDHARWLKEEAQRQRSSNVQPATASKEPKEKKKKSRSGPADSSVGEATAAWGPPQEAMAEPSEGVTREQAPRDADPLLAAWESAFTAESGPEAKRGKQGGEPSLRELFWGEE